MSNSVAEAYLLIVRESNVPIMGEAVPFPFTGQIELDSWSWNLKNDVAVKQREDAEKRFDDAEEKKDKEKEARAASNSGGAKTKDNTPPFKADGLIRQVTDMQTKVGMPQEMRDKKVQELIKKAVAGYAEAATADSDDDANKDNKADNKMILTFEKGADLATTPLLFALARGDLIPKAVLTLFHRSKVVPVTLAITMGNLRITKYEVSCDPEAAISDIKERWEATYETVNWIYQNRPAAGGPNFVTQGTARVFAMKSKLSKYSPI